ncbi:kinase-like domain-containing protein [Penicillium daleae]|uniref:non-specific serine/threonine protein kinase n=1 Tax=Penicillium daleae TaxID=63821 RepID=A0AAD6C135_9EURO|nr:kinase-like domain-containing protein [Penicillium daleae]KAJ5443837.1 kinase-like domain-containing protein [Penicillium daleae]
MASRNVLSSADSASPPFQYVPVGEVERLQRYQSGVVITSRYQVVHKLGYGTYSTTWLCQDHRSAKYVAIKVGTAESSSREVDVLDYLSNHSPLNHPGRAMIPSVQDRFVLHGPNGNHPCYVTAIARCIISGAKDGSYRRIFQAQTARSLIAQLVLAID